MTKKREFVLLTGVMTAFGLAAYLGYKKQMDNQASEEAILSEVRAFFEPMGQVEVVYVTPNQSRAGAISGGVVFDDGVIFEFRYYKGDIDYRQIENLEDNHE